MQLFTYFIPSQVAYFIIMRKLKVSSPLKPMLWLFDKWGA